MYECYARFILCNSNIDVIRGKGYSNKQAAELITVNKLIIFLMKYIEIIINVFVKS